MTHKSKSDREEGLMEEHDLLILGVQDDGRSYVKLHCENWLQDKGFRDMTSAARIKFLEDAFLVAAQLEQGQSEGECTNERFTFPNTGDKWRPTCTACGWEIPEGYDGPTTPHPRLHRVSEG